MLIYLNLLKNVTALTTQHIYISLHFRFDALGWLHSEGVISFVPDVSE
jgi:hypothetical protein